MADNVSRQSDDTDLELLRAFCEGDNAALGELAERYERSLLGLAQGLLRGRRDVAEDAVQEVWARVIRAAPTFREKSSVKTWLYRITINQCLTIRRTSAWQYASAQGDVEIAADAKSNEQMLAGEEFNDLRRAVEALPWDRRVIVLLCHHRGLTHSEAATALQIPIGTLKSRFLR